MWRCVEVCGVCGVCEVCIVEHKPTSNGPMLDGVLVVPLNAENMI